VDREHCPEDGVHVLELLADEAQGQVVEAVAAVALREAHARQTYRRQLGEDLRVVVAGPVVRANRGRKFARAEVAHGVNELLLIRGERQVEHA
jgi:hypothetical protein